MPYLFKLVRRLSIGRLAVVAALAACGAADSSDSTTAPDYLAAPSAIIVTPTSATLIIGDTTALQAEVLNAFGDAILSPTIDWSTSDSSVVSVDSDGVAVATGTGLATVQARSGNASRAVQVYSKIRPVAAVHVRPTSLGMTVGQSSQFTTTLYAGNGKELRDRIIQWSSDRPTIASVDQTGVVVALAAGTATITAESEGIKGTASAIVVSSEAAPPAAVTDLRVLSSTDSSVTLAFTEVHNGTDEPSSYRARMAARDINWSTAAPVPSGSCASVITGTNVGSTRTCVVGGLNAATSYDFLVRSFRAADQPIYGDVSNVARGTTAAAPPPPPAPVANVSVTPATASIFAGASLRLSAVLRDGQGNLLSDRAVSWMSGNISIAQISSDGVMTAISAGSTTITATSGSASGYAEITVTQPTTNPGVTVLFSDTFESGDLTASSNGVRWTDKAYVDVSRAIARSGSHAARFRQGTPEGNGDWAELRFGGLPQLKEVFLEFYLYMPDGTESPSVGPKVSVKYPGGNDKFFRLWAYNYGQPPEVGASTWSRSGGIGALGREYFYTRDDGSVMGMGQGPDNLVPPLVPFIVDANKGRWVQVRIRAKVSGADNRSGVIQMWADGVLVGNDTALHNYPPNGANNFYVNGYLLGWANSGFLPGQMMYIDDVTISTGGFR